MKTSDNSVLKRAVELQKKAIMDYNSGLLSISDEQTTNLITSLLNEEIEIITRLRKLEPSENKNRTRVPASEAEIGAVINECLND